MTYKRGRTKRNYDGTEMTTHKMTDLLSAVLSKVSEVHQERPDLILASWPEVIGAKLASMTQALSFSNGVLTVIVKNSTLYSLLNQHDKPRILKQLQEKFPRTRIEKIQFRVG